MRPLRVGSLFSGIGGIELGLEATGGFETAWLVESEPFCQRVLRKHWPNPPVYGNIQEIDFKELERVDVIAGGPPCQPFSQAGKGRGIQDERHLWTHFARAVRDLRPRYVLVENVPALRWRNRGALHIVLGDLARMGFDAEWASIRAADVGAPHIRERLFVVAYTGGGELRLEPGWWHGEGGASASQPGDDGQEGHMADAASQGRQSWRTTGEALLRPEAEQGSRRRGGGKHPASGDVPYADGERQPGRSQLDGQSPRTPWPCWHDADGCGCATWWSTEPPVGRLAHGIPDRVARLRTLGNAVVPQCAEYVGRAILQHAETLDGHVSAM